SCLRIDPPKYTMTTTAPEAFLPEAARYSGRGVSDEVTREEIVQTERLLNLIDLNNAVLANVSQWILVWGGFRDLSVRFSRSSETTRSALSKDFKSLAAEIKRIGDRLIDFIRSLNIPSETLVYATS